MYCAFEKNAQYIFFSFFFVLFLLCFKLIIFFSIQTSQNVYIKTGTSKEAWYSLKSEMSTWKSGTILLIPAMHVNDSSLFSRACKAIYMLEL